jgi:excinuclease ABC subunit C
VADAAGAGPEPAVAERIRAAPPSPGVYLMRDDAGAVLYVGKAGVLRTRLRSYLHPQRQGPKTEHLMRLAAGLEWFVTDTEVEALLLENSLIKQHHPRFNISLRDDKTYPFLRLSVQEEFPALTVVRRPDRDGARYFGPYIPAAAMHATVRLLRRIFPLRLCRHLRPGRPCLNFQMGRCLAPCAGKVTAARYGEMVRGVSLFLQGRGAAVSAELRRRMAEASEQLRYEEAAELRDQAAAIEAVLERQKVHVPGGGDLDVAGLVRLGERVGVSLLHVREGRLIGTEAFSFRDPLEGEGGESALEGFLRGCYAGEREVPAEIVVPEEPPGGEAIAAWLGSRRGAAVRLTVPRAGEKKGLLLMAGRNAMRVLQEEKAGAAGGDALLDELGRVAGAAGELRSLACMDVSNISGTDAVASLVWWESGALRRQRYRRFRIRRGGAPDDFASLGEVVARLARRVSSGAWAGPDVLLLDGGRGQLAAGEAALRGGAWRPALLLAIAKPSERRGTDAVFAAGRPAPLPLEAGTPVLHLLQRARDEAHRFAVAYHRSLRTRRLLKGPLEGIPGLGPARRALLLRTFGGAAGVRAAGLAALEAAVGARVAASVRAALHPEEAPGGPGREGGGA